MGTSVIITTFSDGVLTASTTFTISVFRALFSEAAVSEVQATLLQANLIPSGSSDFAPRTTATNASLIAYLNAQYAGGAGAGKFVFLRLSSDAPQVGGASRYRFTSADGAAVAENNNIWPQIGYTATSGNFPPPPSQKSPVVISL